MNRREFIRNVLLVASGIGVIPNAISKSIVSSKVELDEVVYTDEEPAIGTKVIGVGEYGIGFVSQIQQSKSFNVDSCIFSISGGSSERERQALDFVINKILKSDVVNVIVVASITDVEAMNQASTLTHLLKKHTNLTSISIVDISNRNFKNDSTLYDAYEAVKFNSNVTIPVSNEDVKHDSYRLPNWMDINLENGLSGERVFTLVKSLVDLSNNKSFIGVDSADIRTVLMGPDEIKHTIWSGNISNNISDVIDVKRINHRENDSDKLFTRALIQIAGNGGVTLGQFQDITELLGNHLDNPDLMVCGLTDNKCLEPGYVSVILYTD